VQKNVVGALVAAMLAGWSFGAAAQAPAVAVPEPPSPAALGRVTRVLTPYEALAEDAADYARQRGVTPVEAIRRLVAQQATVATTDRLQATYRDRLAGIYIEHQPVYRIVILLTGAAPVADESVQAGGLTVPIVFQTGAVATREQVVAAITRHQAQITARFRIAPGLGADPRTGQLLVMAKGLGDDPATAAGLEAELSALTGVPVAIRTVDRVDTNLDGRGGGRVEGPDPDTRRRYACTTGFVVTDGARTGIITAAHCPDTLRYHDPDGGEVALTYVDQWGVAFRDVQVHLTDAAPAPLFYADTLKTAARPVTSWRNRTSTRAGDIVCHRGEHSGYSCAEVELVDYAPPGTLCAGPCDPVWVTVAGPNCAGGDSGGPVFSGTIAFGILKGGSYRRDRSCNFYYYMSTDFLPPGWSLLHR
jgi:hypothetical protein